MYQPPHFRETDLAVLHAHIRAHPLGLMISAGVDGILANPVPFLLYEEGTNGMLRAHVARANPQWQALTGNPAVLVAFQGIDRYITPSWYAQKEIDHKVVPTWNYAIVEARGSARIVEDADWLLAQVTALTEAQERGRQRPWQVADAPPPFVASQLKGIVGIEIPIAAIAGKFKASQNRPPTDRTGILAGLAEEGDAQAAAMAEMISSRGDR